MIFYFAEFFLFFSSFSRSRFNLSQKFSPRASNWEYLIENALFLGSEVQMIAKQPTV